jgi:O-succinylbenzoate synthase
MSDMLTELMADHMLASRALHHARDGNLAGVTAEQAFDSEELALLALCGYSPETIEQARSRAAYLLQTRFAAELSPAGRVLLQSYLGAGAASDRE